MIDQPDPSQELERQFRLEYGSPREVGLRILGILLGSALLYGYSGWLLAWAWAAGFIAAHGAYFLFLRKHMAQATRRDETIAGLLFLVMLISFLWLPAIMLTEPDRVLFTCGAALVGCILVFLVRRSDSAPLLVYGEVVVVASVVALAFIRLIPQFTDPFAKAGLVVSGAALVLYFVEAATAARRLRMAAAEAQSRSLQAEKMAAIGRLAGGVAHDFNNNLTAILGHLELLALEMPEAEREASLREAQVAGAQAARTVKQLLAFARKDRLAMAPQEGAEILEGLMALTRRLIPTSVAIMVETGQSDPKGGGPSFMADRALLLSALINLVVNAVDAMPGGGALTLSCGVLGLTRPLALADGASLPPGSYVRLAVRDTGPGIPSAILPQVLEPFFTTKPTGKGTGLGLPMALGVSRECGGGLTIESGPKGTTVAILLPRI